MGPVKSLPKEQGGIWNPTLKVWTFRNRGCGEVAKILRSCPDVGRIDEQGGKVLAKPSQAAQGSALVASERSAKRPIAAPVLNSLADKGHVSPQQLQKKPSCKVVETGKRLMKAEQ